MEIVHGLNKERRIVLKELHTSEEKGAFLRYEGVDTVIEPELKVWERMYRPEDPPEGYKNAFYQITEECNKNCEYCYNQFLLQRHPGDTTLKQLIKSLDEFVPADPRPTVPYSEYTYDTFHPTVSFIGGEPTVAETLIPFVHYITNVMSNKIYIYTNGIKLHDLDYLKQFPNTSQIMWSISTDFHTTNDFIKKAIDNIRKTNHEYGFNIIVGKSETVKKHNLALDKFIRGYCDPQEIRYRAIIDQRAGTSDYVSNVLKFIERSRGITVDHYLEKGFIGHGGFVNSLKPEFSDDPSKGKVAVAAIPVWGQSFAETYSKWGSYIVNTTYINAPGECHMNSPELYRWRIKHTDRYITEGTKIIWGKQNPYC